MGGSFLLSRLSACVEAGRGLILRRVAHRHGAAPATVTGGVGVQVAVGDGIGKEAQCVDTGEPPHQELEVATNGNGHERVDHQVQEDPTVEQTLSDFHSHVEGEEQGRQPVKHSLAELLALVVSLDAEKDDQLLSHCIQPTPLPIALQTPLSTEQEAVLLARQAVLDAILSKHHRSEQAPDQLVLFAPGLHAPVAERQSFLYPLSVFALNDASLAIKASMQATRLDDALPDNVHYVHLEAVLDGCAWDASLVLNGYSWQRRSTWLVCLDTTDFEHERLQRHLSMIGTLTSLDSAIVVVYVTPDFAQNVQESEDGHWMGAAPIFACGDLFALARDCGFQVSYVTSLRDAAAEYGLPPWLQNSLSTSLFADQLKFACFKHMRSSVLGSIPDINSASEYSARNGLQTNTDDARVASSPTRLSFVRNTSTEKFEDYANSDTRALRFELQVGSIPPRLSRQEFSVVLIGSDLSFGCWDPKQAKKMHGNIWETTGVMAVDLALSVEASTVEYKYAITNAQKDIIAWEEGSNRVLAPAAAESVQYVREEWRS
ncbi:unnamed protein product [Chondrus crispus]|uniref:CBM20 domain-containing protein n=1 Tax=Chondrus crispus TaxID=2769 RepID=R7QH98_CHOCR|nr:unnamed protein product [Chondrus crispus]CDF37123.1 unnamed protein product [Chondrus crispus]|eukprot:XP_005716942.1 unnamed protein product [Chondrus crispus]